MDCALEDANAYFPWFEATLGSLEIWMAPEEGGSGRRGESAKAGDGDR